MLHPPPFCRPSPRRAWRRSFLVVAAVALACVGVPFSAAPAAAHNYLVSASPADGAAIAQAPGLLELVFSEAVRGTGSGVVVTGPDGKPWEDGAPEVVGTTVTQPLTELGPAGSYTIRYRIVSADGHPITGTLTFELTAPGPAAEEAPEAPAAPVAPSTPTPAPIERAESLDASNTADDADGGGVSPWLPLGAAGVLAVLVTGVVMSRRRDVGSDDD